MRLEHVCEYHGTFAVEIPTESVIRFPMEHTVRLARDLMPECPYCQPVGEKDADAAKGCDDSPSEAVHLMSRTLPSRAKEPTAPDEPEDEDADARFMRIEDAIRDLDEIDWAVAYYAVSGPMADGVRTAFRGDAAVANTRTFNRLHRVISAMSIPPPQDLRRVLRDDPMVYPDKDRQPDRYGWFRDCHPRCERSTAGTDHSELCLHYIPDGHAFTALIGMTEYLETNGWKRVEFEKRDCDRWTHENFRPGPFYTEDAVLAQRRRDAEPF